MGAQLSAPQIVAQRVIKKISLSSYRLRFSMSGSPMDEKFEMMELVGIVCIFMQLFYQKEPLKLLLYEDIVYFLWGGIYTYKRRLRFNQPQPFVVKTNLFIDWGFQMLLMRLP